MVVSTSNACNARNVAKVRVETSSGFIETSLDRDTVAQRKLSKVKRRALYCGQDVIYATAATRLCGVGAMCGDRPDLRRGHEIAGAEVTGELHRRLAPRI